MINIQSRVRNKTKETEVDFRQDFKTQEVTYLMDDEPHPRPGASSLFLPSLSALVSSNGITTP
jgi:hypothetical protein